MNQKFILVDTLLETQTAFHENGKIVTTPCGFELDGDSITPDGDSVSMAGRMTVDAQGRSVFNPFRTGTGRRFDGLYDTEHAEVKCSKHSVFVTFRFEKSMTNAEMSEKLLNESVQIQSWFKSLRTKTVWR